MSRLAAGATYTTENKLSVTVEFHRNGAGLGADEWRALSLQSPAAYEATLLLATRLQEMPTRSAWFVYATWRDWPVAEFDLTALARINREDASRLAWLELRWHATDRIDTSLQWQVLRGRIGSEYGASPQSRLLTGTVKVWF